MYGAGNATGLSPVLDPTILPDTAGNDMLVAVSVLSFIVIALIIISTIVRIIAKRFYKN